MRRTDDRLFRLVAVGVSTGGVAALKCLLGELPDDFPLPLLVVAHISPEADDGLALLLDGCCPLRVKEADDHETARAGTVYLAPANYHLLVSRDGVLSLSVDPPVHYARPSVDVLFESAAAACGPALVGIVLTGAGCDGSAGLLDIRQRGGLTIVQDPADAEMDAMPRSALQLLQPDHVLALKEIPGLLRRLAPRKP